MLSLLATIAAKDQEIAEARGAEAELEALLEATDPMGELEAWLEHAQRCRESEVADLMRQRTALESKLREAEETIEAMRQASYTARADANTAMFNVEQQAISYQKAARVAALQDAKEK
jgi:predicted  nucleic acid-binding Zn-ribbon protein